MPFVARGLRALAAPGATARCASTFAARSLLGAPGRALAASPLQQPTMLTQAPGVERGSVAPAQLGVTRGMTSVRLRGAKQARRPRPARIWPIPENKWYLFTRDWVEVFSGKRHEEDASLGTGQIIRVERERNQVYVEGINKRRMREEEGAYGGERKFVEKEAPVHFSQCSLLDPKDQKWCRHRWAYLENGRRVRVSRRSGLPIEIPRHEPTMTKEARMAMQWSEQTTLSADVLERTYIPPLDSDPPA